MVGITIPSRIVHSVRTRVGNARVKTQFLTHLLMNPRQSMRMTVQDMMLRGPNYHGLLVHSMIHHRLYLPAEGGELLHKEANAGRYVAFDPRRKSQLGGNNFFSGKLGAYYPDEIRGNPGTELTPTELLKVLTYDHATTFSYPTIDELIQRELLSSSTFGEMFKFFKYGSDYLDRLRERGVDGENVYVVTPKGNGLIIIEPEDGDVEPLKDVKLGKEPALVPV